MKIAFVTTQSLEGSTVIGRVLPLAQELRKQNDIYILGHGVGTVQGWINTGRDPFRRTTTGKQRQRGFALVMTMLVNAVTAAVLLVRLQPDVIIIVKSLPESVLAARLAVLFARPKKIILDVDDFELTANQLTSWLQRLAIHWAERSGARLTHHIVAATPFLADHFEQLTQGKRKVTMIPTGLTSAAGGAPGAPRQARNSSEHLAGVQEKPGPTGVKVSTLIYTGSVSLASGHRVDLLPEILQLVRHEIPNTELHIYGTGDDVETLKKMFTQKKLTEAVVWHGRFLLADINLSSEPSRPNSDRPGARVGRSNLGGLEASNPVVMIDPIDGSITNRAKSSFRVALAAAHGLPVVTSDIGIRPYLLPDTLHPRLFAKPADAADYAAKIVDLLRNPLTDADQQALRAHAQANTWLQLAEKYAKIIAA